MLQLQRASAGSGKTYTLTGKYIRLYLEVREQDGTTRLRTPEELEDAVGRTLAITFTNKATNEMKERIVGKLAELSRHTAQHPADYAAEIIEATGASDQDVARTAGIALSKLLHAYSDFQVSTIDSFFQTILRTFAFEADLNDAFELEIDSDNVERAGMDATLAEVNSPKSNATYWIKKLMSDFAAKGDKWNIFQGSMDVDKPNNKDSSRDSIYDTLREAVNKMQNEGYKRIRREMDEYFEAHPDWPEILSRLESQCIGEHLALYNRMITAAKEADRKFRTYFADLMDLSRFTNRSDEGKWAHYPEKILTKFSNPFKHEHTVKGVKKSLVIIPDFGQKKQEKFRKKFGAEAADKIYGIVSPLAEMQEAWEASFNSEKMRQWSIYGPHLPLLALMNIVKRNAAIYLRDNNLVELGETNALLERIIGDDDAPFIYERTGIMTDHYLIDEFQDTSAMQWSNLRPLLRESESRGNDNLIIGDAKQSIYRFRNADSSLITRVVPREFPDHESRGDSEQDNTNYRSALDIVEFNNSLYSLLPSLVLDLYPEEQRTAVAEEFTLLYGNAVQRPHKADTRGYISIELKPAPKAEKKDDSTSDEVMDPAAIAALDQEEVQKSDFDKLLEENREVQIILDAIKRGYKQSDIAVLVHSNDMGRQIINILTRYNSLRPAESPDIDFVSEESLIIGDCASVKMIVSALETISRGAMLNVRSGIEAEHKGVANISEVSGGFSFYAMNHPEIENADMVDAYLSDHTSFAWISDMLSGMHSVALPALVEAITAHLAEEQRNADAPYIAAFQDLVLEYCDVYSSDTASFLNWWEKNKHSKSISSPEGTNAVNVMTIHKSKGLQFKVVILPAMNQNFSESKICSRPEWRWVEPTPGFGEGLELPPYLPVETTDALKGSIHEPVLNDFVNAVRKDLLNSIYVATTRAVDELYILVSEPSKDKGDPEKPHNIYGMLRYFVTHFPIAEGKYLLPTDALTEGAGENRWTIGTPQMPNQEEDLATEAVTDAVTISGYSIHADLPLLAYHEEKPSRKLYDEEDPDPRSEGNVLHDIMANVGTPSDIPQSVKAMRMRGLINSTQEQEYVRLLSRAVEDPLTCRWFSPGLRIINERAILGADTAYRPDRIVVTSEGDASVIDYKFGESRDSHSKYLAQIRNYVTLLQGTGLFRSVKGYLWYVKLDEVVKA